MKPESKYLTGEALWGDDLDMAGISSWYESEKDGYYDLATNYYGNSGIGGEYEYAALNYLHAFDRILRKRWGTCVALGCADGGDVEPLASVVEHFVAIEPAEKWWKPEIGGKPARFLAPEVQGTIPLDAQSVDLIVSLGVLHHIPNVSKVLAESGRILRKDGILVLREPITSMGNWWEPRAGLTSNERGLPEPWLRKTLEDNGYVIVQWRHCMFSPLAIVCSKFWPHPLHRSRLFCFVDWVVSAATAFNSKYYRPSLIRKFAPSSAFIIARKT